MLVVLATFIKVRVVGLYFMELRQVPRMLRGIFEIYCLVLCAMILAFYFLA